MAGNSSIEWTNATWNPVTGCTKVSAGCTHCYAERMAKRLQAMGSPHYKNGFAVTLHPDALQTPLQWRKPRMIFVNSMSDLFHEQVPLDYIKSVFQVMREAHWHTFQVLTKRSARMAELAPLLDWPPNVWMGVTVELQRYTSRIDDLVTVPARVRFLSLEPLLGPIMHLELAGIDWVIVGGESGPRARPMRPEWVKVVKQHCLAAGVPFFFKQWGGFNKKKTGRILDGRTWDQYPAAIHDTPPL